MNQIIQFKNLKIANDLPFVLIGGLNVLEDIQISEQTCDHFVKVCQKLNIAYIFKASFDKANRTSIDSYRGVGLEKGLEIFQYLKGRYNIPILTDVHETYQAQILAKQCDFLQLPAFLARQTDLIKALADTGAIINIKKPQFLAPEDMQFIVQKFVNLGNNKVMICERGSCFGYHNLVVDFLGFEMMKKQAPLIFDASHCLQKPTAHYNRAGGRVDLIESLAKAAIVQKIAGIFIETHPNPKQAKCDADCALALDSLESFLTPLKQLDQFVKKY